MASKESKGLYEKGELVGKYLNKYKSEEQLKPDPEPVKNKKPLTAGEIIFFTIAIIILIAIIAFLLSWLAVIIIHYSRPKWYESNESLQKSLKILAIASGVCCFLAVVGAGIFLR